MRVNSAVVSCLGLLALLSVGGCRKSSPTTPNESPDAEVRPTAADLAARKTAAETVARLEANHFAGVSDAGQIMDLYRKKFAGWRKATADGCTLWSALDAVDRGVFPTMAVRDAVLVRIKDDLAANRPRELDSEDQYLGGVRTAIKAAVDAWDDFKCDEQSAVGPYLKANDDKLSLSRRVAAANGSKIVEASRDVQERVFFHTMITHRLEPVMKERAPELVKKLRDEDRVKHPYVLQCDTHFLKLAAPEESYAIDGPDGEGSEERIKDDLIIEVAEGAARNPRLRSAGGSRTSAGAFFDYPPALKTFAKVCDGTLNETWAAPDAKAPAAASKVVWHYVSTAADARTEDLWQLRALVRLSDKAAKSGPQAAPWMLVLGIGSKDKWRLAAFPIAPERFISFSARVTVKQERNVSAPYEKANHDGEGFWRVRMRGVAITCRPAPADAYVGDSPGRCEDD